MFTKSSLDLDTSKEVIGEKKSTSNLKNASNSEKKGKHKFLLLDIVITCAVFGIGGANILLGIPVGVVLSILIDDFIEPLTTSKEDLDKRKN